MVYYTERLSSFLWPPEKKWTKQRAPLLRASIPLASNQKKKRPVLNGHGHLLTSHQVILPSPARKPNSQGTIFATTTVPCKTKSFPWGSPLRYNSGNIFWVFPKIGIPHNGWWKSWKTLLKWMIWGYRYFRKHPYRHGRIFPIFPWKIPPGSLRECKWKVKKAGWWYVQCNISLRRDSMKD